MPITWGTLEIKAQDLSCPPAKLDINQQKLVPHGIEQVVSDKMMILFGEQVTPLSHSKLVPNSDSLIFKIDDTNSIKYTREVDYHIDYVNGTINRIAAGSILDGVNTYLSYNYYDFTPDTMLIPEGLNRRQVQFEVFAEKADYDSLVSDYHMQVSKTLTLIDGSAFGAYITDMPKTVWKPGSTLYWFTIVFTEA